MSAVNVFLYTNCAVVMTDGLAYTDDGQYVGLRQKVSTIAHLNAIVAGRGPQVYQPTMAATLNARPTFDDAVKHLGTDLKSAGDALRARMDVPEDTGEIYLVGRSEASGEFQAWLAVTNDVPGLAGFRPAPLGVSIAPSVENADQETQALAHMARTDPLRFDPTTDGLALMRGQRRAFPRSVGGFAQLTFVNETEIVTRILERWPTAKL